MKIPCASGKEIMNALLKDGFSMVRQKGSHVHLSKKTSGKTLHVTVPLHSGKDINPFVFKSIARQAGLTADELTKLL